MDTRASLLASLAFLHPSTSAQNSGWDPGSLFLNRPEAFGNLEGSGSRSVAPELRKAARAAILCKADFIVPGYGPIFKVEEKEVEQLEGKHFQADVGQTATC